MNDNEETFIGLAYRIRAKLETLKRNNPTGVTRAHLEQLGLIPRSYDDRIQSIDSWIARLRPSSDKGMQQ